MRQVKHVLYASCLCAPQAERQILEKAPEIVGQQIQKYHRLLTRGLVQNGAHVAALSYHPGLKLVDEDVLGNCADEGVEFNYIRAALGGAAQRVHIIAQSFLRTLFYLLRHQDAAVICDVLNFSVSFGAVAAARCLGRQAVGIVTDFPDFLMEGVIKSNKLIWTLIKMCTSYVLLTEAMKERIDMRGKKSVVLEGQVDSQMKQAENTLEGKDEKRICIYAGGLSEEYGLKMLDEGFRRAGAKNAALHLYGAGSYVETLQKTQDDVVVFHGIAPNAEVVAAEMRAELLINPRPTHEEFTRFSFPSKNMEYMVSGTPVLTTKLPGMPKEYEQYVYLIEEETSEGMERALREVLSKSREELHEKGMAARRFVLEQKNNVVQAGKILDMLNA